MIKMEGLNGRPEILSVVEKITDLQKFKNYKITDVSTNAKGEGYLGEIFMVSITNPSTDTKLDIVIKAAFTPGKIREMAPIRASFENEIFFYSTLYPTLEQFGKNHGINKELNFAPKCLYSALDQQPEVLVLENLRVAGFEIFSKKQALDHDHAMLIFKNYGRYHALSMAFIEKNPEQFAEFSDKINMNVMMQFFEKEHMVQFFMDTALLAQKSLRSGEDDDLLKAFEKYTNQDSIFDLMKNSLNSNCDYAAFVHGDCWSNNMMFKYENSKPVQMRLIDFQLIKVGNPVCDLSYFFYSGISKEGLQKFDEYLHEYYKSFSETATKLGSNPEKIFPRDQLKTCWTEYAKFGMIMTFMVLKIKMLDTTEVMDLADMANSMEERPLADTFKTVKFNENEYNERMRAVIRHMYDLNAL